uniref:sensor histidine kinase n=2 Tax=Roseivirga sp. TaxID=1964215 RepID=UPI004048AD46
MIKNRFRRSLLVLFMALAAPIMIYGIFALTSLTADESELEQIYERQLEAVLFSINQYTQDVIGGIATKMDNAYEYGDKTRFDQILQPYKFFKAFEIRNLDGSVDQLITSDSAFHATDFALATKKVFDESKDIVGRLSRYKDTYQKIEPRELSIDFQDQELALIQFVIGSGDDIKFCTYYFSGNQFIEQILGTKIQEISRGEFIIVCKSVETGEIVYANIGTEDQKSDVRSERIDLLPQYELGISRTGSTIQEAVGKRKYQNLGALILLMVFLLFGILLVLRNIRKEMELAQSKADFVSNVSHEIRTPLALINMFAETLLLDRVKTEEKKHEYYQIITKEVGRLTNMINRILSFSKIEAEKREYNKSPQDINTIAQDVVNTYSYHLESHGFEYAFNPSEQLPLINADKEAMIEVLVNLIDNGMKYSKDEKSVIISTGKTEDFVFIEVADKGIGIPKGQLNKLFDKFYRVPTGDVHDTKGSGLGLSIVKHIVEAHDGKIRIQSTVGSGSTFRLLFPMLKSEA